LVLDLTLNTTFEAVIKVFPRSFNYDGLRIDGFVVEVEEHYRIIVLVVCLIFQFAAVES